MMGIPWIMTAVGMPVLSLVVAMDKSGPGAKPATMATWMTEMAALKTASSLAAVTESFKVKKLAMMGISYKPMHV